MLKLRRWCAAALAGLAVASVGCGRDAGKNTTPGAGKPAPVVADSPPAPAATGEQAPQAPQATPAPPEKPAEAGAPKASAPAKGVATVNGSAISEERFAAALRDAAFGAKAATMKGRMEVLNRLIDEELGRQEALASGARRLPVVQRWQERQRRLDLLAQLLRQVQAQGGNLLEAEVDAALGPIPKAIQTTLLLVDDGALAIDLVRRIKQGETFESLAAEHAGSLSIEGVRRREFVTRPGNTMYPPAVEAGLFSMKQGDVASFGTPAGSLVVRVDGKRDLTEAEVAEARGVVRERLVQEQLQKTQAGMLEESRRKYPVKRLMEGVADHPVVARDSLASWRKFQETPFATVGPLTVMLDELYRDYGDFEALKGMKPQIQEAQYAGVVGQAVSGALYALAAKDRGLAPSAALEARIARETPEKGFDAFTVDLVLAVKRDQLTRGQCIGYFEKEPKRYLPQARLELRQVLVRREAEAKQAMARLQAGEDFAKVAREVSVDASAAAGGGLGWRSQNQLAELYGAEGARDLLERAAKRSDRFLIIRTTRGYHVIQPLSYRAPGEGSYEDVEEAVLDDCLREQRRLVVEDLARKLRAKATITIDEARVAAVEMLPGRPPVHGSGMGLTGPSPHGGGGMGTPSGGGASPHGGMGTPSGGGASPHGGMGTPAGGGASPHGGMGVPAGGSRPPGHP